MTLVWKQLCWVLDRVNAFFWHGWWTFTVFCSFPVEFLLSLSSRFVYFILLLNSVLFFLFHFYLQHLLNEMWEIQCMFSFCQRVARFPFGLLIDGGTDSVFLPCLFPPRKYFIFFFKPTTTMSESSDNYQCEGQKKKHVSSDGMWPYYWRDYYKRRIKRNNNKLKPVAAAALHSLDCLSWILILYRYYSNKLYFFSVEIKWPIFLVLFSFLECFFFLLLAEFQLWFFFSPDFHVYGSFKKTTAVEHE